MSDQKVSILLFAIAAGIGLVCGFLRLHVYTPVLPGIIIGAIAGYFYEKHRVRKRYDEPYFFRLNRLSTTGVIAGTFLCLAAYQVITWVIE